MRTSRPWSERDSFPAMPTHHVLIVSPHAGRRDAIAGALRQDGHVVAVAEQARLGAEALEEPGIDFLVVDLRSPDLAVLALRAALDPATPQAPDSLEDAEQRHIVHVLRHTRGNKRQAALILGISRSTLLHKVRKYGIVIPRS
jgi:DNA-binding NtrC family response regulator